MESDPDSSELSYSSNDEEEEEEERQEEWEAGGCEFRKRSLSGGSSNNVITQCEHFIFSHGAL